MISEQDVSAKLVGAEQMAGSQRGPLEQMVDVHLDRVEGQPEYRYDYHNDIEAYNRNSRHRDAVACKPVAFHSCFAHERPDPLSSLILGSTSE